MRAAQKYQDQYEPADTVARQIRPSTAKQTTTNTITNSPKRGPRPRTAHPSRGNNLTIKSIYSVHNSPSKVDSRATNFDLSVQLQRLRDEINGLSPQLTEEVPSEMEDVDTAFDDESKRWFARELYSLKLECEKAKRMKKDSAKEKQITQLLKLHRTTLRVIQVAASRPILRILNPHIYSDLGGLIRELSNISNNITTLPKWDSEIILEALDEAILFPSRKNSKKSLINPQDFAGLLAPRKTVPRKSGPSAQPKKEKNNPYRFFDQYEQTRSSPSKSNLQNGSSAKLKPKGPKTKMSSSKTRPQSGRPFTAGGARIGPSPKKRTIRPKTAKSSIRPKSASRPKSKSATNIRTGAPRVKNNQHYQRGNLLRQISITDDFSEANNPPPLELRQEDCDESYDYSLIPSGRKKKLPLEHSVDDLLVAAHPEGHLMPGLDGIIEPKTNADTAQSSTKIVSTDNVQELNAKLHHLQVQPQSERFSRGEFEEMVARLEKMEREETEMRARLNKLHTVTDKFMRYSSLKAEEDKQRETEYIPKQPQTLNLIPTEPSVDFVESTTHAPPHVTPSVRTADEIVTQAIQEAYDKEQKTQIQNQTCTPANLTNEMADIILDEVVDSVFEELEAALDDYVDEVYDGEVNCEIPDESNTISILSNENSFQQSSIINSTQISSETSAA